MKFVDITNDIDFRKTFGNGSKQKSLILLLNAVINLPQNEQIIDVEITNTYLFGKFSSGKSTKVDLKAKDNKGNIFIVEMQVAAFDFFHKRILYYTSQSYDSQIDKGVRYDRLKQVYFIGILKFEIGKTPNYFRRHKVLNVEFNEQILQVVEFNLIELPKFTKKIDQLQSSIYQWTYYIKNAETLILMQESKIDDGLKEAYNEANQQNWTIEELGYYLRVSIKERDEIGRIEFTKKKVRIERETKGIIEGEKRKK